MPLPILLTLNHSFSASLGRCHGRFSVLHLILYRLQTLLCPQRKRGWSGGSRFLCIPVTLPYLVLCPLVCKVLGSIRRFPRFLLTLGAGAGVLHAPPAPPMRGWLPDALGAEVRRCAHSSGVAQIAQGGVCRERPGGDHLLIGRQVREGQGSQGETKHSSLASWDAPCPPPPPRPAAPTGTKLCISILECEECARAC